MPTTVIIPGRVTNFELRRELPSICLVCGKPAEERPQERTFLRWHPALLFSFPIGLKPFVAGALGPV